MRAFITGNKKIIAVAIWIFIWQLASMIVGEALLLPSPYDTLAALFKLGKTSVFYVSVLATLVRVLAGLLISIITGVALGIASAKYSWLSALLAPMISTIKAVPVISFVILLVLYFKASMVPVAVCVLLCFPIMYTNTQKGMLSMDKKLIEMAKLHKVSGRKILTHIKIPAIFHYILSAILICIGFSWKSVVTAEVLSAPLRSIGYSLYVTRMYVNTEELFAWTLVIVILSITIEHFANSLYKNSKWYAGG